MATRTMRAEDRGAPCDRNAAKRRDEQDLFGIGTQHGGLPQRTWQRERGPKRESKKQGRADQEPVTGRKDHERRKPEE